MLTLVQLLMREQPRLPPADRIRLVRLASDDEGDSQATAPTDGPQHFCRKCNGGEGALRPLDDFYQRIRNGRVSYPSECKACQRDRERNRKRPKRTATRKEAQ